MQTEKLVECGCTIKCKTGSQCSPIEYQLIDFARSENTGVEEGNRVEDRAVDGTI